MLLDGRFEIGLLLRVRQFAVLQQVGHFEEVALFGQLLDRIAAIQQFALVAVDEGHLRLAAGGRKETGVVREQTGFATQGTDIDTIIAVSRRHDREIDGSLSRRWSELPCVRSSPFSPLNRFMFLQLPANRKLLRLPYFALCAAWPPQQPASASSPPLSRSRRPEVVIFHIASTAKTCFGLRFRDPGNRRETGGQIQFQQGAAAVQRHCRRFNAFAFHLIPRDEPSFP